MRTSSIIGLLAIQLRLANGSLFSFNDDQFAEFYPKYNNGIQTVLRENCSNEYDAYLQSDRNRTFLEKSLAIFTGADATDIVVECILNYTPEYIKLKMSNTQVLFGLAPTILATLGTNPQETATLSIAARRPLLAILIAAGCPAVFTLRSVEYTSLLENVTGRRTRIPKPLLTFEKFILPLQYLIVCAAIINVIELSIELGNRVIFALDAGQNYGPVLWFFIGFVCHLVGTLALSRRIKVSTRHDGNEGKPGFLTWVQHQFSPSTRLNAVNIKINQETLFFFFVSWFTSVLTIAHIIYGTILFSGATFISIKDALRVIGRYMGSVVACRMVLSYEILVFRSRVGKSVQIMESTEAQDEEAINHEDGTHIIPDRKSL